MHPHLIPAPTPLSEGYTALTEIDEATGDTGIAFGLLRLPAGGTFETSPGLETAWLLLEGHVSLTIAGTTFEAERRDLFGNPPVTAHFDAETAASLHAVTACEVAIFRTRNPRRFPTRSSMRRRRRKRTTAPTASSKTPLVARCARSSIAATAPTRTSYSARCSTAPAGGPATPPITIPSRRSTTTASRFPRDTATVSWEKT